MEDCNQHLTIVWVLGSMICIIGLCEAFYFSIIVRNGCDKIIKSCFIPCSCILTCCGKTLRCFDKSQEEGCNKNNQEIKIISM